MFEIFLAAWIPVGIGWLLAVRFGDRNFRNAYLLIAFVILAWMSPCWMSGRSPGAFEYLFDEVAPWSQPEAGVAGKSGPLMSDVPLQFVPWRTIVTASLLRGEIPYLNRFAGAGTPLLENPQAAPFALATILGLPFSSFAWPLFAGVLRLLLATTGMYLFLRRERLHETASVTGAIAWGFCAYNVAFLEFPHLNTSALLPWLLLAIRVVVAGRWESGVAGAACVAMMIAGGHPESVLHIALLAIPYAGWLVSRQEERSAST